MSHWVKYTNIRILFDAYFSVYALGFCLYTGKFGSQKIVLFAYLMQCLTESMSKARHNILLCCTYKILCMKHQTCCTDIFQCYPQVAVYISGNVTMHLLGINTEFTEFQPNSTEFKLESGVDVRVERIKTTWCDLRIFPCDILEVSGKDHNVSFFFV